MNLDKYYTSPEAAKIFFDNVTSVIDLSTFNHIIEPSAGDGGLLEHLPKRKTIALDIAPEGEGIKKQDFFDFVPPKGKILTYMNPPFGKRCSLAIDFFNRASLFSSVIACIVPVTFEKYSVQNRLAEDWALVFSERLPEKSFTKDGKPYRVRCVQQIWVSPEEFANELHKLA